MKGSTFKRCGCTDTAGKSLGASCPRLKARDHGSWYYKAELPPAPNDKRRTKRKGGFATRRAAQAALIDLLDRVQKRTHVDAGKITVGHYLDQWLAGKGKLRPGTRRTYNDHIRLYLRPALGHLRLEDLTTADIEPMYATIRQLGRLAAATKASPELAAMLAARDQRHVRPISAATIRRVHTTLMSALNTAARRRLVPFNPAAYVELEPEPRAKAVVWTDDRVAEWRVTGQRPKVAVWTPQQTGAFLDHAAGDRLYALYLLIAFRGLRRGEAIGLPWTDVDLDRELLTISQQVVQYGSRVDVGVPKSESGARTIAMDSITIAVLRSHRARQAAERLAWGSAWVDTGLVFTREDGSRLVPERVSRHFNKLVRDAGLPPIRLHHLRHGAATLALASGANLKVVSEMLGHSTIGITANTYTSVLPELAREAAEAAARLVPRSAGDITGPISVPSGPAEQGDQESRQDESAGQRGGRGIRTHGDVAASAVFKPWAGGSSGARPPGLTCRSRPLGADDGCCRCRQILPSAAGLDPFHAMLGGARAAGRPPLSGVDVMQSRSVSSEPVDVTVDVIGRGSLQLRSSSFSGSASVSSETISAEPCHGDQQPWGER